MSNVLKLQKWLIENKLDVFILFRNDEFLSEYIAPYAERLKWISNFSGSAGKAVIKQKSASIFVDGRYIVQVQNEINKKDFSIEHISNFYEWLKNSINQNFKIAIDPHLHSIKDIESIKKITNKNNAEIKYLQINPIDKLWHNQPQRPSSKAFEYALEFSGESVEEKIFKIQKILKRNNCDFFILSSLDSIAWLLNLRGNDITYNPVNLAYAIISKDSKIELFINKRKIKYLKGEIFKFTNFHSLKLIKLFIKNISNKKNIGMDQKRTPFFFKKICKENFLKLIFFDDPCILLKAQKNKVELKGARLANMRDGASITKFIYWLKNEVKVNKNDEIEAAQKLYKLRKNNSLFYSLAFETISAVGKNAALPHYRVTKKSNLKIKKNSIYLFDSGAQYLDGTTDITRTVIIGTPTKEQKDRFTRVLKGHIAIATCSFKKGTQGSYLDPLARKSLLEIGCDYDHGTGHGVGNFLNVHEGPQRIAKNTRSDDSVIKEGMIISNEPGFYKKNDYGIRIENLIITKKKLKHNLIFETISFAPIDIALIDTSLLTPKEMKWINSYHKKVYENLKEQLNYNEQKWLKDITQPIKKN